MCNLAISENSSSDIVSIMHLHRRMALLSDRSIGLKVLTGQGAAIDTTTAAGRLSFGIFAALAEFESELIRERTMAGLQAARARGRKGGRTFTLTKAQVRTIQAAMAPPGHIGLTTGPPSGKCGLKVRPSNTSERCRAKRPAMSYR